MRKGDIDIQSKKSYGGYFGNKEGLEDFCKKIPNEVFKNNNIVHLLDIGAGTGVLPQYIKNMKKKVKLTLIDIDSGELLQNLDISNIKIVGDSKKILPTLSEKFNLIISRVSTHYEKNEKDLDILLSEVALKMIKNSFFVEQRVVFEKKEDQELFLKIHKFLKRDMTLFSKDVYLKKMEKHFSSSYVVDADSMSVMQNRIDTTRRYNLSDEDNTKIVEMIENHLLINESNIFFLDGKNYYWYVTFKYFINKK